MFNIADELMKKIKDTVANSKIVLTPQLADGIVMLGCSECSNHCSRSCSSTCTGSCKTGCSNTCHHSSGSR